MSQPVVIAQLGQLPVLAASEMCHDETVEFSEPDLGRAVAKQRANDIVQTENAAAEIEIREE